MLQDDAIERGVADRLRTLLRALDRRDRLETGSEAFAGWLDRLAASADGLMDSAREVMLRALRGAGDPVNYGLLRRLEEGAGTAVIALMATSGLDRIALVERVHDLVQVGLAAQDLVSDEVRATPLGRGLVALVEGAAGRAGAALRAELGEGGR